MRITAGAVAAMAAFGLASCQDGAERSRPEARPDGGTPSRGHHVVVVDESPAAKELQAISEVERLGGSITIPNRDGTTNRIVSRVEDGGARFVEYYNGESTRPVLTIRREGDLTTHWGDYDEDSRTDSLYDLSFDGGVMVQLWLEDTNGDGELDQRRTQLGSRQDIRIIRERLVSLDGGGRGWRVESDREAPAIQPHPEEERETHWSAGTRCDSMAGFPADMTSTTSVASMPAVNIVTGTSPGACTSEQTAKLIEALKQIPDSTKCLGATNSTLGTMMQSALASDIKTFIGCGGQCPGIRAATDPGPPSRLDELRSGPYRMNLAPYVVAGQGLERTLFHELLHWSTGLHHEEGDNGTDQVWSCARFCSRCTTAGFGGGDPAADCARCAARDQKLSCGWKMVEASMGGCEDFLAWIGRGVTDPVLTQCRLTDTVYARCNTCNVAHWSYCDGTQIPVPAGYNGYSTAYRCCTGCYVGTPVRDCANVPSLPIDTTTCQLPMACATP
ncbi:hypothetical protein ACJ2CR_24425 [Myxococcus faecalis]|uniref:hypothetical protein n=1 Tax=Myxococcus faecalis TaxID=3115646 RepID=UPI0038CF3EBF